jgi:pSer/pThr/pTyr-binding forkhead associated (FHA) protein
MKERIWTIGSSPGCDIRVDSSIVSGQHCRLTQRGQTFLLEDLASKNGTFVAGERIDHAREVRHGEPITLGLSTPMPWPNLASITVGRLSNNDVVIPLDMVSGRHARLEREGNRVFLIDLDSRNGISLNDPLNKISRAAIQPGDVVFLGTHKVLAAELLAALPNNVLDPGNARQATKLEASPLADLAVKPSPAASKSATLERSVSLFSSYRSARSWAVGIGLSAVCIMVVMGASWIFRTGSKNESPMSDDCMAERRPISTAETSTTLPDQLPRRAPAIPSATQPSPPSPQEFDEQLVRKSEKGVYMLCIRSGSLVAFIGSTAWAISPDTIVCPTDVLKQFESMLTKGDKLDDCIVVCSPSRTLRIMKHSPADGEGAFLSIGRLEASTEAVPFEPRTASAFMPEPGQKLAVLVAAGATSTPGKPNDDPATISRRLISLKIDRIQRDAQQAPLAWYCTAAEDPGPAVAAPVFDGAGQVVGCVESATKTEIRVVPISRLATLHQISP